MMKVCFVTTSFVRSQDDHYARFVYEQAKSLLHCTNTEKVTVIAPHGPGMKRVEIIDDIEVQRFRYAWPQTLEFLAYRHEGLFKTLKERRLSVLLLPLFLTSMFWSLWKSSRRADVIHAQWIPTAAVALLVKLFRRLPVVVSVRGADINTAMRSRPARLLTRAILKQVDQVITVSDDFVTLLRNELHVSCPVEAVYNGVDQQQFKPRSREHCRTVLGLETKTKLILYAGGLIERKGVDILITAVSRLPEQAALQLLIVGEGPLEIPLRELVQQLNLNGMVHFMGKVARNAMHLYLGAANLFVLPSYSEGRPNVVLEAMSCARSVIATNINGTRELIRSGENGLLFEPGDAVTLSKHIESLLDDESRSSLLGQKARQTILDLGLTWEAHGAKLGRLYERLLANPAKA